MPWGPHLASNCWSRRTQVSYRTFSSAASPAWMSQLFQSISSDTECLFLGHCILLFWTASVTAPSLLSCSSNLRVRMGLLFASLLVEPRGYLYADHLSVQLHVKSSQWPWMAKRISSSLKWRNGQANNRFVKCDICCIHSYLRRSAWGRNMQMFYWWGRKLFKRLNSPSLNKSQENTADLS